MSDPPGGAGQADADEDAEHSVHVHDAQGTLIGRHGRQINYFTYVGPPRSVDGARPAKGTLSAEVESPYRGLIAFGEQDAAFFFGREAAADEILGRLAAQAGGPALMVVSGVSGAGKSSLLHAGVLSRIGEAGLTEGPGGPPWPHLVLTPARAPLSELADHVAPLVSADAATLRQTLRADPSGFALTALEAAGARKDGGSQRLLLVVDQFEQVFTQCSDESERRAFLTALHAGATTGHGPKQVPAAVVILVVRADFEARCADYEELAKAVQDRYLLRPMTERQLRLAITEPARVAGSAVDDALVGELVRAVRATPTASAPGAIGGGAGVLPHLSHALDQAWRTRAGDVLTLDDYERAGGIEGSIAASADRAYASLTPGQQEAARQVFIRLTATSADGTDTADRARRAELTEGRNQAEAAGIEAVLEAFAAKRLLTLAADSVELSHEVLLTAWPLLRDSWLAETHADRIVRTQLRTAAASWTGHGGDSSYLYRGTLLHAANGIAARISADPARNPPLGQAERDFLQASNGAGRRARRLRRAAIAGLASLTLAASAIAGIAMHTAGIATKQHAVALSRLLAADSLRIGSSDPFTARQLAVASWAVSHTAEAGSAMTTMLAAGQHEGTLYIGSPDVAVNGVAFSPNGKLLATADSDGTVWLMNPATGRPSRPPLVVGPKGVRQVTFSPDGKLLATVDDNGFVKLWNPATGRAIGTPLTVAALKGASVNQVAFSPDGKLLAAIDKDGNVHMRDPASGHRIGTPIFSDAQTVAFSPSSKLLAVGWKYGPIELWNPATGRQIGPSIDNHAVDPRDVNQMVFSPNGKILVTVDGTYGPVDVWDATTGGFTREILGIGGGSKGSANGVAFSPDGKLLATADKDGTARLWNPLNGRSIGKSLNADLGGTVNAVAFSHDGSLLATADSNGTVRLWHPATGQPAGTPLLDDAVNEVALSPNGDLVIADKDGTVKLWNPANGDPATGPGTSIPADLSGSVNQAAFSPDGKVLATVGSNGTVQVWNLPMYTSPYQMLCADAGPLRRQAWEGYAANEAYPEICSGR